MCYRGTTADIRMTWQRCSIELWTTYSSASSDMCHSYTKHRRHSNTGYSPLFHNIQIDVHFLPVPLFRFTSSVSSSEQKFASEISACSLYANNNSGGLPWFPSHTSLQNDRTFLFSPCAMHWMGYANFVPHLIASSLLFPAQKLINLITENVRSVSCIRTRRTHSFFCFRIHNCQGTWRLLNIPNSKFQKQKHADKCNFAYVFISVMLCLRKNYEVGREWRKFHDK